MVSSSKIRSRISPRKVPLTTVLEGCTVLPTDNRLQNGAWLSLARALEWGSRGRQFKSVRPDLIQMEEQKQERRRATRIKKPLTVHYYKDSKWDITTVMDLSETGICVTTEREFAPDTVLKFRFKLPSDPFEWVVLKGRVVVSEKRYETIQKDFPSAGYLTKVEFVDVDPQQAESIRAYVNWCLNRGR